MADLKGTIIYLALLYIYMYQVLVYCSLIYTSRTSYVYYILLLNTSILLQRERNALRAVARCTVFRNK